MKSASFSLEGMQQSHIKVKDKYVRIQTVAGTVNFCLKFQLLQTDLSYFLGDLWHIFLKIFCCVRFIWA